MGRKSEAKKKLIEKALALIWENSYHAIGVNEICKKAGVKPGSFYYFFPSKRDLALAAMEFHWAQAKEEVLEPAFHSDIPPLERIKELFESVYTIHAAQQKKNAPVLGCAFGSFVGELGRGDETIRNRIQAIFSEIGAYFERALRDAVSKGDLKIQEKDVPSIAQALVAYYEGILLLARASNDAKIIRELIPYALNLLKT
jgi:TetR/AcrR family transcriptional repressor of nem operon